MKPAVLCLLLLLSACELDAARNYRVYSLTWTCLSPEGCEHAQEATLIDRAQIVDGDDIVTFRSTRDGYFLDLAQMVPSDELPAGCSWLYGFAFFGTEVEPSRFCRRSRRIELDLSIPNQDPATRSEWLVEGRDIDP